MSGELAPASAITCDLDVSGANQQPKPDERPLRWSWIWLSGATLATAAAVTAKVGPDAATWFGVRGPRCPLEACLGPMACPGCGLVRSVCATMQGDVGNAFTYHPGGIVIAALLPATALLHLHILRSGRVMPVHRSLRRAGHIAFVLAVAIGWALRYFLRS